MDKTLKRLLLFFSMLAVFTSCKDGTQDLLMPNGSVYNEIRQHGDLSITLEAIEMAGLQQILSQDNITFFAPTDSAFISYMQDVGVDSLTGLYNFYGAETFKQVILYHLLEKKVKGMDVVNSYVVTAATNTNGNNIHAYISSIDKNISLNSFEANVCERDIEVEGSVIHKIDGVLSPLTLNGLIRVNPNFSKLKSAISKTQDDLETILNQSNMSYTIFAPNDVAITAFLNSSGCYTWNDFLNTNNAAALSSLLKYHIINGETQAQDLSNNTFSTLFTNHWIQVLKEQSGTINIQDENGTQPTAVVKTTNITAVNGTIHIIDKVLEHN